MINQKEKKKLIEFIYSRERPEGGFSFSRSTPPTLEDTYFALKLLEELKQHSISRQTIFYITQFKQKEFHYPKHLYQLAIIYRITHNNDLENSLRNKIINKYKIILNTLSDLYYMTLTKEILALLTTDITKNEKDILLSAQMKPVKSMEEYKQLIILMKKLNVPFKSQEYARIIQDSQNPDGGFGIVPNSTSYLESTYHALKVMKVLDVFPIDVHQCKRFIDSCIAKFGGYGRQTITVPSLEYSYYALMSLKIIGEKKKSKTT